MQRMSDGRGSGDSQGKVRVWDAPTRLFHWLLAALVLFAWVSWRYSEALGDPTLKLHRWNGHAVLVLIVFRLLWGLVGSSTSRFSAWLWWPWTAIRYGMRLLRGETPLYLSHNPLGSYMIFALLGAVTAQAMLGLFTVEHNDITAGPLYRLISEERQKVITGWHTWWFYWVILALVPIHILANLWYGLAKKEPLITAMITGNKPAEAYEDAPEAVLVARPLRRWCSARSSRSAAKCCSRSAPVAREHGETGLPKRAGCLPCGHALQRATYPALRGHPARHRRPPGTRRPRLGGAGARHARAQRVAGRAQRHARRRPLREGG
jgi:cytochrome b